MSRVTCLEWHVKIYMLEVILIVTCWDWYIKIDIWRVTCQQWNIDKDMSRATCKDIRRITCRNWYVEVRCQESHLQSDISRLTCCDKLRGIHVSSSFWLSQLLHVVKYWLRLVNGYFPSNLRVSHKTTWNGLQSYLNALGNFLKHPWPFPKTSLEHSQNFLETPLKLPWNLLVTPLKHPWNILETSLKHP